MKSFWMAAILAVGVSAAYADHNGGGNPQVASSGNGGGWNGGNNWQLQQVFSATWQQANEVEWSLARAPRLQSLNGFWNGQVCGTLRQLRQVIGGGWGNGGWNPRFGKRERIFEKLFGR